MYIVMLRLIDRGFGLEVGVSAQCRVASESLQQMGGRNGGLLVGQRVWGVFCWGSEVFGGGAEFEV